MDVVRKATDSLIEKPVCSCFMPRGPVPKCHSGGHILSGQGPLRHGARHEEYLASKSGREHSQMRRHKKRRVPSSTSKKRLRLSILEIAREFYWPYHPHLSNSKAALKPRGFAYRFTNTGLPFPLPCSYRYSSPSPPLYVPILS